MGAVLKHPGARVAKQGPYERAVKELMQIPGVGVSIADDLWNISITSIEQLKGASPEQLYDLSNRFAGVVQDRCLLYVFRCAVYYAETPADRREKEKLKWWNWKDQTHRTNR